MAYPAARRGDRELRALVALMVLGLGAPGCADGMEEDAGTAVRDGGADARIDAPTDAPTADTRLDAEPPMPDVPPDECARVSCTGLTHCVGGTCVDYPGCRGDGTCPTPGDVCRARRCIPGGDDPDGDGSPASEDCDETNPMRSPRLPEVCNNLDDNCNGAADDGDPATMCSVLTMRGICMSGMCSCPPGTYDFDPAMPGCECTSSPAASEGASCAAPVDLGDIGDSGAMTTVSANALRGEVWYRFRGVDSPDTSCDNYHVRVQFTTNPGDAYELTVSRGACDALACDDTGFTDFSWATDLRATIAGRLTGQCPCSAGGVRDVSRCEDDSADYFVRVRRRSGAAEACEPFVIEISNGAYDTP